MEIEDQLGCRLPFTALFAAPTIDGLGALIRQNGREAATGAAGAPNLTSNASGMRIRPVEVADIDAVCRLLQEDWDNRSIQPGAWRRLFEYAWIDGKPNLGFVVADGDRIVGFLGCVYSRRWVNGKAALVCNLTSWFVRPDYRGWGAPLLAAAVRDDNVSYIALTPAPVAHRILRRIGFASINRSRMVFPPLFHISTLLRHGPAITFDPERIVHFLNTQQRRIFDDHSPYGCLHAVLSEGGEFCYLVAKRRVSARAPLGRAFPIAIHFPYSELLYCSAPDIVARHMERTKLAILYRQRTAALVAEQHIFPKSSLAGIALDGHCLYRSSVFDLRKFDHLYSELVLLPL
jgi:acetoacetyl-CoA synthetase